MADDNDLERRILELLRGRHLANLATVEGQRPNVSAVEFVNDGLTLYFVSIPGTQKVANLAVNPAVALTVNGPGRSRREVTGVQYYGRAKPVTDAATVERIKTLFFDKYLFEDAAHWFGSRILFYEVTPERVDLVDYGRGFGHKDVLVPTPGRR
ncbi:MAG: pyridoxamine 5'-phosphate oxidase family protein [Thermoanaerobaculales bacterium]|nr:pyridoxamine 5'-phosphate oxidase family protein [Thermoanaerobaculales bacterium]